MNANPRHPTMRARRSWVARTFLIVAGFLLAGAGAALAFFVISVIDPSGNDAVRAGHQPGGAHCTYRNRGRCHGGHCRLDPPHAAQWGRRAIHGDSKSWHCFLHDERIVVPGKRP